MKRATETPSAPGAGASAATRVKWAAFGALERLSDLRGNVARGTLEVRGEGPPLPALWVFVSTIGELNAIEPLLRRLAARLPHLKLVLITDHPHYRVSYEERYPDAEICVTRGHSRDAARLAAGYPPRLLVVAEIPCLPSDAPCRFSFAFVLEAKRRGAPAAVVNGWLYHYRPACRMDAIERSLFARDYLRAFDAICVQTEEVRERLIGAGAPAQRLTVTGNIKFDAMQRPQWRAQTARSPRILASLLDSGRPTVVAGCVTDAAEQAMVLDAFLAVRERRGPALLVLAPRHPEVAERMEALGALLGQRALRARFRSTMADVPVPDDTDCVVLDTMGELRDFYAAATVAHVGVDHNVLEPMAFGKPVSVVPGWHCMYPSYPVYRLLADQGALSEVADAASLAAVWDGWIAGASAPIPGPSPAQAALERNRGATERHLAALRACLDRAS